MVTRMKRFSKQYMRDELIDLMTCYEKQYGFTERIGTDQVKGKSDDVLIDYGKYELCQELLGGL